MAKHLVNICYIIFIIYAIYTAIKFIRFKYIERKVEFIKIGFFTYFINNIIQLLKGE